MSKQIVAQDYAYVLDSCYPRERRAVRLELLEDGTLVVGDWSEEGDLFDAGSEILFTPENATALAKVLASAVVGAPATEEPND